MGTADLFGIAAIIAALGSLAFAILLGWAFVTWAKRCHPKNPAFRAPSVLDPRGGDDERP